METTLFFKTMVLLCSELVFLFGTCYAFIFFFRKATLETKAFTVFNISVSFVEKYNDKGELDLLPLDTEENSKANEKLAQNLTALWITASIAFAVTFFGGVFTLT